MPEVVSEQVATSSLDNILLTLDEVSPTSAASLSPVGSPLLTEHIPPHEQVITYTSSSGETYSATRADLPRVCKYIGGLAPEMRDAVVNSYVAGQALSLQQNQHRPVEVTKKPIIRARKPREIIETTLKSETVVTAVPVIPQVTPEQGSNKINTGAIPILAQSAEIVVQSTSNDVATRKLIPKKSTFQKPQNTKESSRVKVTPKEYPAKRHAAEIEPPTLMPAETAKSTNETLAPIPLDSIKEFEDYNEPAIEIINPDPDQPADVHAPPVLLTVSEVTAVELPQMEARMHTPGFDSSPVERLTPSESQPMTEEIVEDAYVDLRETALLELGWVKQTADEDTGYEWYEIPELGSIKDPEITNLLEENTEATQILGEITAQMAKLETTDDSSQIQEIMNRVESALDTAMLLPTGSVEIPELTEFITELCTELGIECSPEQAKKITKLIIAIHRSKPRTEKTGEHKSMVFSGIGTHEGRKYSRALASPIMPAVRILGKKVLELLFDNSVLLRPTELFN